MRRVPLVLLVAAAALGGCGGGDNATEGSSTDDATVSVVRVGGVGDVLVDAQGDALYAADQESGGRVSCIDSCAAIWLPLTVEGEPRASDELDGELGTVERPDGTRQVTYDGKPLYTFIEDAEDGAVSGNGLADDFEGTEFTWHVMTPSGPSTSDANSGGDEQGKPKDPYGGGYER